MHSQTVRPETRKPENLAEARGLIRSIYARVTGIDVVPIAECSGRCLADDVVAPVDLPRFDAAAMDGYAIRSADLDSEGRASLRIVDEIAAGHPSPIRIEEGEAARIYTGAMIPPGADLVVVQESCRRVGNRVSVRALPVGKPHVRLRGEDVLAGQRVLTAGAWIAPAQLALLQALQVHSIPVLRRLRVALVSIGDELLEGQATLKPGDILDSNRPMLRSWLERTGCEVTDLGIMPDAPEALLARLVNPAAEVDLIVTSGSASVGPADHMSRLIGRRGYLEFWKLGIRPGKPVGLGDIDDCPILALPGNPMAAAVCFTLIGRWLIARLSGDASARPESLVLPLGRPVSTKGNYLQVLAGRLGSSDGGTTAEPLEIQGSASLMALAGAEGLILLPGDQTNFAAGDRVEFVRI